VQNISTLYELASGVANDDYTLLNDIDMAVTNPANVDAWSAGTYTEGAWVKHTYDVAEHTYYCAVASTTEEPGAGTDWEEMWVTADGWPGILFNPQGNNPGIVFDGDGFALRNCWIGHDRTAALFFGLSNLYESTIKNLRVENIQRVGDSSRSALAQTVPAPAIVEDVYVQGSAAVFTEVGFLTYSVAGTVRRCFADATITSTGHRRVFGFAYSVSASAVIEDCGVRGSITMSSNQTNAEFGGFARIVNAGGVVENCYAAVSFTNAPNASGFIWSNDGTITDCFWDTDIGPATSADGSAVGRTTAQMKDIDTFTTGGVEWDMVSGVDAEATWGISGSVNDGYPFLQSLYVAGEAVGPVIESGTIVNPTTDGFQLRFTTDTDNGTAYYVLYPTTEDDPTDPEDIKNAEDIGGVAPIRDGSVAVTTTGEQTFPAITGLDPNTTYRAAVVHYGAPD
jgi:hypothetical protein